MGPSSRLVTAERDGYFAICPSTRLNLGEAEGDAREQTLQSRVKHKCNGLILSKKDQPFFLRFL